MLVSGALPREGERWVYSLWGAKWPTPRQGQASSFARDRTVRPIASVTHYGGSVVKS